jgi:hypothetical protein
MRPFGSKRRAVLLCLPFLLLFNAAPPTAAAIAACVADAPQLAGGDLSVSQDCRYTPGLGSISGVLGLPRGPPALIKDVGTDKSAVAPPGEALARLQCCSGSPVGRAALHCLLQDNAFCCMRCDALFFVSSSLRHTFVVCRNSCIPQLYVCAAGWL